MSGNMQRIEILKRIFSSIDDECVITSTGMISREAYQVKDRPRNFYVMGSMGSALAIGIGLAYSRPDLKVVVIDGDGSALMSLGTMVLSKKLNLPNLKHYIIDNNCHSTTGGQPTCSDAVDFRLISNCIVCCAEKGKSQAPRIPLKPVEIQRRFRENIKA